VSGQAARPEPTFFPSASDFRRWLAENHDRAGELWLGIYKKGSGRTGISYLEAVEEALCYGWIDGLARGHDEHSYVQRFTPRRRGSNWSEPNIARAIRLIEEGRMQPVGLAAFEARRR
jgi:uncharacterized protein YdeI (YjbR/CyaY-like superfamily)